MSAATFLVTCNKCGYSGDISEFPEGRDFFQHPYVAGCPKCDNADTPGGASMRMFNGPKPFTIVRSGGKFDKPASAPESAP